jgi:hypothetical protein
MEVSQMRSKVPHTSFKIPDDVRALLMKWSAANLTSMNAELVRCARERAQREQQEADAEKFTKEYEAA